MAFFLVANLAMLLGSVISFDADARSLALHADPNYSAQATSVLASVSRHEWLFGIQLFCLVATFVSSLVIAYTWAKENRSLPESPSFQN